MEQRAKRYEIYFLIFEEIFNATWILHSRECCIKRQISRDLCQLEAYTRSKNIFDSYFGLM